MKRNSLLLIITCIGMIFGISLSAQETINQAAINSALKQLSAWDYGQPEDPLLVIDNAIAVSHKDPNLKTQLEDTFVSILQSNASPASKKYVCSKLMQIGSSQSVPVLATFLNDQVMAHMARFALEQIGDPAVDRVLLDALPHANGLQKVGIIESLGNRRVEAASVQLIDLLNNSDAAIVKASIGALGRIGNRDAAKAMASLRAKANSAFVNEVTDAELLIAKGFLKAGDLDRAYDIYNHYYKNSKQDYIRLAGFNGILAAQPKQDRLLLSDALKGEDPLMRGYAASIITKGGYTSDPYFIELLGTLPAEGQVVLIDALATLKETAARKAIRDLLNSKHESVRLAALTALGIIGDEMDILPLAQIAAANKAQEGKIALNSLTQLKGEDINTKLGEVLNNVTPAERIQLINAMVIRNDPTTVHAVVKFLSSTDAQVRIEAITAVGALGNEEQVSQLLNIRNDAMSQDEQSALDKAINSLCSRHGEKCTAPILKEYNQSDLKNKIKLLNLFPLLGSDEALSVVSKDSESNNADLRDAAIRSLAVWPNDAAMDNLFKIAQKAEQLNHRVLAIRGYVRLVETMPADISEKKADLLVKVAGITERPEELKLVLGGLGNLGGSIYAMKKTEPFLDTPSVETEACMALLGIMRGIGEASRDDVVVLLRKIKQVSQNEQVQSQVARLMSSLGIDE